MNDFPSSPHATRAVRALNVVLVIAIGVLFVRALTGCGESPAASIESRVEKRSSGVDLPGATMEPGGGYSP